MSHQCIYTRLYLFFLMIRRPPRSTLDRSSAASDVYKRQADTRVRAALVIHHVSAVGSDTGAVRLGCEFAGLSGEAVRSLQLFIDQVEKRRRVLALSLIHISEPTRTY